MASLKRKIDRDRFLNAQNRTFDGLTKQDEKSWNGDFSFVVMADTQLGMLKQDKSWDEEADFFRKGIRYINKIRPRFVVVCGDLVNAYPHKEKEQEVQVKDFKNIASEISEDIPLVCVCGNHDVGDKPTRATIDLYKERFGDDYFIYWVGGVRFIVLNTQLHKDESGAPEAAAAQDKWLEQEVEKGISEVEVKDKDDEKAEGKASEEVPGVRTIALSHIPPFITDSNEEDGYFNLNLPIRRKLLNTLRRGGCTHWFCGHYHRNAGGVDRGEIPFVPSSSSSSVPGSSKEEKVEVLNVEAVENVPKVGTEAPLEVIVSSAVGCVLLPNGQDPLGLKGFKIPPVLTEETSGLRVATVNKTGVSHRWFTLADLTKPANSLPFMNDALSSSTSSKAAAETKSNSSVLKHENKLDDDGEDIEFAEEPQRKRRIKR